MSSIGPGSDSHDRRVAMNSLDFTMIVEIHNHHAIWLDEGDEKHFAADFNTMIL